MHLLCLSFPVSLSAGDNRIILHGGANTASWALSDAAQAAISSAGAVLLQREIPEAVNTQVAQVRLSYGIGLCLAWQRVLTFRMPCPPCCMIGGVAGPMLLHRCSQLVAPHLPAWPADSPRSGRACCARRRRLR